MESILRAIFVGVITAPKRVNIIARQLHAHGGVQKEKRGGSRFTSAQREIRLSIISHIKKLHVIPSHYNRDKSSKQYLPNGLSTSKLWNAWKEERKHDGCSTASYSTYKKIFYTRFHLSFRSPRTDVCSQCVQMRNEILALKREGKMEEYHALKVKRKLHHVSAKRFYQRMKKSKSDKDVLCVTFDLQKNLALPKINITEAYYARQMWLYNLGIVVHDRDQSRSNVFFYTWLESESGRGSNEVVSALSNFLLRMRKRVEKKNYRKLALFSDSCSGQNKNATMVAFLLRFVNNKFNIFREVNFTFPVRGHSYMPPDRVFGRVEKLIRKEEVISSPEGYYKILEKYGRVYKLGEKWKVFDYKGMADTYLKTTNKMGIQKNRVWNLKKGSQEILVSNTYKGKPTAHKLLRVSAKKFVLMKPSEVDRVTHITEAKRDDVTKLLSFIDLTPDEFDFYEEHLENICTGKKSKGIVDRPIETIVTT